MPSLPKAAWTGAASKSALDDGYQPERCAENTRKFIADEVFALFRYIGTSTSLAALSLLTRAKVPVFVPFSGAQCAQALAEQKLAPVASPTVECNSVEVAVEVQKRVAAAPDAVVQVCNYACSAAFVRAARKAG